MTFLAYIDNKVMDYAKIQLTDPFATPKERQIWMNIPAPRPVIGLIEADEAEQARRNASKIIDCPVGHISVLQLSSNSIPVFYRAEACRHVQSCAIPRVQKYPGMELLAVVLPKDNIDQRIEEFAKSIHCNLNSLRSVLDLT